MIPKVRLGMIGGGRDAFIGSVHRKAALLDNECEIVAGALSSDPARAAASGDDWGLDPARAYASFEEMLATESARDTTSRIHAVAIVTPNHMHYPAAAAALAAGFHVICDKPLCQNMIEARALEDLTEKSRRVFAVTYHYTGYPMIKHARHLVASGALGEVRKVVVDYAQGWLSGPLEADGQKQAAWRTDPAKAGPSCCMGDIGTHAFNLAEYVTGLRASHVCAHLNTFVPGRALDDDGSVLLRFESGAAGVLTASQVSAGKENALSLRVSGTLGTLEWNHEDCNTLTWYPIDGVRQVYRTGVGGGGVLAPETIAATRFPAGHPEGFLEAFANIYRGFAHDVRRVEFPDITDMNPAIADLDYPTVQAGVRGVQFIDAVVRSAASEVKWSEF